MHQVYVLYMSCTCHVVGVYCILMTVLYVHIPETMVSRISWIMYIVEHEFYVNLNVIYLNHFKFAVYVSDPMMRKNPIYDMQHVCHHLAVCDFPLLLLTLFLMEIWTQPLYFFVCDFWTDTASHWLANSLFAA